MSDGKALDIVVPEVGTRAPRVNGDIADFLANHPDLELGGAQGYTIERRKHMEVFALHRLPKFKVNPIRAVEFTAIRGPHGTIPIRVLYPDNGEPRRGEGKMGGIIYFHGGGYCTGSVDEFENGLRLLAEESACIIFAPDYRLAPEFPYPTQLDEFDAVIDWVLDGAAQQRGVDRTRLVAAGDGAGGSLATAVCMRRRDEGKHPVAAQVLLYPATSLPTDTPAAEENRAGFYLQFNGIFGFADHYLPHTISGPSPTFMYVAPGKQPCAALASLPPAAVVTNGYDPLRDVGLAYAGKLRAVGGLARWRHYADLTHAWLQMTAWSAAARDAARDVGLIVRDMLYGQSD
ncbi:hypothetical protein MYCTH_2069956 [Thermothelomyces thermophilus ATCC 42464]|uniref:Alpha/beta hydrolase fold-3 domain-containing protein n=1 Tax=Thermothelomyces thermophilus (strain ATCC 42464 / BCRC 31852 / DSM 1799) TaxID=573729 RepID=G2QMV6_THET4|nr:uncharacterized protein MYCTH_2069956 [Thermothelomyces thermophilus ATCC 42464]AEO60496.1 hypothetical protein MYCTH_2069956 [Thermothelomyces thermophilus ATCC 42464]